MKDEFNLPIIDIKDQVSFKVYEEMVEISAKQLSKLLGLPIIAEESKIIEDKSEDLLLLLA